MTESDEKYLIEILEEQLEREDLDRLQAEYEASLANVG